MSKTILLHNTPITIRPSTRAKRMRLAVYCDGTVVVTQPRSVGLGKLMEVIEKRIGWIQAKIKYFAGKDFTMVKKHTKAEQVELRKEAKKIVQERLEYFNKFYQLPYGRVTIKNQKSRWGSCSIKRNLNFNYRIALISPELQDYLVVHELCHLKEFNHSENFWNLVEQQIPNYKQLRRELRRKNL
jgi:predicted metal-dependent hydrolase